MQAAVHLPQVDFDGMGITGKRVDETVRVAREHGFAAVSANDHFVFSTTWLDGLTLLARAACTSGDLDLVTSIVLAPLRGPVAVAAALGTLAATADGAVIAGVGPGSSASDYAALGVPFEQRWARLDETIVVMRALFDGTTPATPTRFYPMPERWSTPILPPARRPVIWIASWGSAAGLRRVARLADGWLASAYNTDPGRFAADSAALSAALTAQGRGELPRALATMWTFVTEDRAAADRVLTDVVGPLVGRDPSALRGRLCIGPAEECAALLTDYAEAGCSRVHFWPVASETKQIELLATRVLPLVGGVDR